MRLRESANSARIFSRRVLPSITRRIFMREFRCGWYSVSQQLVFLAFFEQGLAADAQDFGGAANFVMGSFERGADGVAFDVVERAEGSCGTARAASGSHQLREIGAGQQELLAEHQAVFDGVLKLAHVSGPHVEFERTLRGRIERGARLSVNRAEPLEKMRDERRNVRRTLAQRRNGNRQHV